MCRVLQLTSYDEEQSELDNLTVLKKLQNAIQNKLNAAHDWLMVILIVHVFLDFLQVFFRTLML